MNTYPTVTVMSNDLEGMMRIRQIWSLPLPRRKAALAEWQQEQQEQRHRKTIQEGVK